MATNPLRAMSHYRELPAVFGPSTLVIAAFARTPYAMLPLGIMVAFTAATGDIAIGGLVTAVFSIAVAVFSPLIGRAADIFGQRRVLLVTIPSNSLALLGLFWASISNPPTVIMLLLGLLAGMTSTPIGSFTRARWVGMDPTPRTLMAAFSYESMVDEFVFVLGPAFVGIAATVAAPSAPLLVSFTILLLAGLPFAFTAPSEPVDTAITGPESRRPAIGTVILAVAPSIVALIAVGAFFGSSQAAVTARAEELGAPSIAGLVYATMGISSAITSLLVVTLSERFSLAARFVVFSAGTAIFALATASAGSLGTTAMWLFFTGAFIGPTLVTAFTLAERLAPSGGIAVAMTLMTSSVTVGVSLGSAVGGAVAETKGSEATLFLGAGVILVVAVMGLLIRRQAPEAVAYQVE